jgi:transcriptional regulator GlxA family with amidase domain
MTACAFRTSVACRVAKARGFLAEPNASISQVAYTVGFHDLSHFGRTFRRLVGEPATRCHQRVSPDNFRTKRTDTTAQKTPT